MIDEEEKNVKREYGRKRYWNMSKEDKHKLREYGRNTGKICLKICTVFLLQCYLFSLCCFYILLKLLEITDFEYTKQSMRNHVPNKYVFWYV